LEAATKEILNGYLEKAQKKLEVAEKLFNSGDYEDSVSRAYYAIFHATQGLLLTEGQKADTHKGVVTLFSLLFVKTGKFRRELLRNLANLKDERETGDYEIFSYTDRETAGSAIKEAKEFLTEAKNYLRKIGLIE
jgi:uncharacterized protein (UPF0332 family)